MFHGSCPQAVQYSPALVLHSLVACPPEQAAVLQELVAVPQEQDAVPQEQDAVLQELGAVLQELTVAHRG